MNFVDWTLPTRFRTGPRGTATRGAGPFERAAGSLEGGRPASDRSERLVEQPVGSSPGAPWPSAMNGPAAWAGAAVPGPFDGNNLHSLHAARTAGVVPTRHPAQRHDQETLTMLHLSWLKASGSTRGKPHARPLRGVRWLALGLLGASTMLLTGCQSGPLSRCRLFSPCGFLGRATSRVLHPSLRCLRGGCGGVDGCASSDVIMEPPAAIYGPPIGTVPSTVTPVEPPTDMSPAAPSAKPGPAPSTGSTAAPRTGYRPRTSAPRTATRPDRSAERTSGASPEPTTRSARASSSARIVPTAGPADGMDWLDHLPPLDLPGEVTRSASGASSPAPNATTAKPAEAQPKPTAAAPSKNLTESVDADGAGPAVAALGAAAPGPDDGPGHGARSDAAQKVASPSADADDDIALVVDAHPGIDRFTPVDPTIAGGSEPNSDGLAWLADKGYRTIVDLRDTPEVSPTFIGEASRHGLRYVALPVTLKTIDKTRLDRFHFELGLAGARPLYFFDSDGNRAGALWYVRRVAVDQVASQIAEHEAEDVGLVAPAARLAAVRCVEKLGPPQTKARSVSLQFQPEDPTLPPEAPTLGAAPQSGSHAAAGQVPPAPLVPIRTTSTLGGASRAPETTRGLTGDDALMPPIALQNNGPTLDQRALAWRPLAAIAVTGLTVPLAYWTSAGVPALLAKGRANLTGPAPRPRPLPPASDD